MCAAVSRTAIEDRQPDALNIVTDVECMRDEHAVVESKIGPNVHGVEAVRVRGIKRAQYGRKIQSLVLCESFKERTGESLSGRLKKINRLRGCCRVTR